MTDTTDSISDKTDRLESIIEQLEDGNVSLEPANVLHGKGTAFSPNSGNNSTLATVT